MGVNDTVLSVNIEGLPDNTEGKILDIHGDMYFVMFYVKGGAVSYRVPYKNLKK